MTPLFAELGDFAVVGRVADALQPQNLGRHVVSNLLVLGHPGWTAAVGNGVGDLAPQPCFQRQPVGGEFHS